MKTLHRVFFDDSREMKKVPDSSVDLVVTSPPYPMISMWDSVFSKQNPAVAAALRSSDGDGAFELMHRELDKVWRQMYRVLKNGGFACINIGDATRSVDGDFKMYLNHSRVLQCCLRLGFNALPMILWRKQTNAPNKFMGSGMLPAGAYVTLEHEYLLILRKGGKRVFKSDAEKTRRKQSAFFWEERNLWFSDFWEDLKGTRQSSIDTSLRERSGAYPFELAYRLINMFSLKEDTVLDPFLGTGTTMFAAMAAGRNSIGIELDLNFREHILSRIKNLVDDANTLIRRRIQNHIRFVQSRLDAKKTTGYVNKHYGFPVMTRQETEILLEELTKIDVVGDCIFEVEYTPNGAGFIHNGSTLNSENA
jgi:DNA modification methylase